MAGEKEVKLILTAEDDVSSVIKKVTDYLGDTGLGQAVTAVSTSFLALEKAFELVAGAAEKVFSVIQAGAADAAKAENTNKMLAMSMSSVGQYTEKAFLALDEWADSLENATGKEAEAFKQTVALGTQMGMSVEQSKMATQAALDLAAATGSDLESAFRQIGMTLSGSAGKLEKFIPELRELTKEELENGKAVEIIGKKYDGFASNMAGGYTGGLAKFDQALGKIPEAFGRMIAQNPAVIAGLDAITKGLIAVAGIIDEFSTYVIQNGDDLKVLAISFGVAAAAVGTYIAIQNAAAIAMTVSKIAAIALNTAMTAGPFIAIVAAVAALTAGLYYLYKNFDLVTGAIKVGLGYALEAVTFQVRMFLTGIGKVVGFFNEDWGNAIQAASDKIESLSENLKESGRAQMDAADKAKKAGEQQSTSALMVGRATDGIKDKMIEVEQESLRMSAAFSKSVEQARSAFAGLKDFMPRMNLNEFKNDSESWKKSIEKLKADAENLKVKLSVDVNADGAKEQLDKVNEQLTYALEAEKALRIKTAVENRGALIKEEQIRLDQVKAAEFTSAQEIAQMRLAQAQALRTQSIDIETQRLLELRGLASVDAQEGNTAKQAAMLQANEMELTAYKTQLDTQMALAVDMETQKQLALAEAKASALGSSSPAGKSAQADLEIVQAQEKQAQLQQMRANDLISEQEYQSAMTDIKIQAITLRTQSEVEMNNQRVALLGTSPEAMAVALENEQIQAQNELLILQEKYANQMVTDEEFRIAKEEAENASAERQSQIKQQMLQRDLQQNQTLKNQWAATLASMRLEQEKHGALLGTIKGVQQSKEYAAMNQGLSDISSLRSSSDRKAFEAGKIAAITQATIQTFLAATGAYASLAPIPIVGPALGIAAAAAAIAAGINNVAQIKSQKFQGGAHGGIDEVPKSMNNSTFVLKAGERVVQPGQNKELGEAVDKINSGDGTGGHTFNITLAGDVSDATIAKVKESIMDAIRETSERGTPIMHEKGLIKG